MCWVSSDGEDVSFTPRSSRKFLNSDKLCSSLSLGDSRLEIWVAYVPWLFFILEYTSCSRDHYNLGGALDYFLLFTFSTCLAEV